MLLESLLSYAHLSAVLGLVVFLTAKTTLMRSELLGGQAGPLRLLRRLDAWSWAAFAAVGLSGAARVVWGAKGAAWYLDNPLLWTKVAFFALMLAMALPVRRALQRWQAAGHAAWGSSAEIVRQRRWLMIQTHVMAIVPLFAALLAYGF